MRERIVSAGDLTPEQRRVHRVEHILRRDGGSPGSALEGLASIIEDGDWRRVPASPDDPKPFASFTAFVEAPAPFGLGYSIRQLRALLNLQHPDEEKKAAVRERIDAMRTEVERLLAEDVSPAKAVGRPINNECGTSINTGTAQHVLRRLKRDAEHDPEAAVLAEQVINGETSANAAARAKGWRKPRIVVSSPARTAVSLRKHMTPEARHELARLLMED